MSERYSANPNSQDRGADQPHVSRYLLARGFIKPGEVVVDAACGAGYGSALLAEIAKQVISMDKLETFDSQWQRKNIAFMVRNLEDPGDFPDCDSWVSIETIEHLADPQAYLDKVTKATKRAIIMSSPNKETKHLHEFHLSDVLLINFAKMMEKYEDEWFHLHDFIQGYTWISIYVKKGTKIL